MEGGLCSTLTRYHYVYAEVKLVRYVVIQFSVLANDSRVTRYTNILKPSSCVM